jgi:hypothetical protein
MLRQYPEMLPEQAYNVPNLDRRHARPKQICRYGSRTMTSLCLLSPTSPFRHILTAKSFITTRLNTFVPNTLRTRSSIKLVQYRLTVSGSTMLPIFVFAFALVTMSFNFITLAPLFLLHPRHPHFQKFLSASAQWARECTICIISSKSGWPDISVIPSFFSSAVCSLALTSSPTP